MASNTSDFFTFSKTAGTAKNLQKPTDGGDNNLWGGFINVDLDTIVGAVNATSDLIADANQNELVDFTATGSAVNHVGITNAATGNGPTIEAKGDDTNIDLNVSGKGTGVLKSTNADFTTPKLTNAKVITGINDTNGNELVKVTATGSAVNEITVANAATGNGPTLSATGDDTNIDLNIAGKGSGTAKFTSNIIIPDAGNIGSVSDPDAIAIASDGGLTFNGGIDNAGTISAGTIGSSVAFPSNPSITLGTNSIIQIIKNVNGTASNQDIQLGGTTSDDGMFYIGYYRVPNATTVTITTPTEFDANSCVLTGNRNGSDSSTIQRDSSAVSVVRFSGANTISLENSSAYHAYFYFCLIKFK
jgi:hypothetical protein